MKKGLCNVIALYDLTSIEIADLKSWFTYVENWFHQHGQAPTRMGLIGEEIKSQKTTTFVYGKRVLEKRNFQNMKSISIYATLPDSTSDMFDFIFFASIDLCSGETCATFCFDNDKQSFSRESIEGLIINLNRYLSPSYGFAMQRAFNKGPIMYPYGAIGAMGNVEIPKEEEEAITKWMHHYGKKYKAGELRDIYPLNILSKAHLDNKVGNQSLEQWIKSSSGHGELKPLTDTLWSWWVLEDNIAKVREALRPAGFIVVFN